MRDKLIELLQKWKLYDINKDKVERLVKAFKVVMTKFYNVATELLQNGSMPHEDFELLTNNFPTPWQVLNFLKKDFKENEELKGFNQVVKVDYSLIAEQLKQIEEDNTLLKEHLKRVELLQPTKKADIENRDAKLTLIKGRMAINNYLIRRKEEELSMFVAPKRGAGRPSKEQKAEEKQRQVRINELLNATPEELANAEELLKEEIEEEV